MIVTVVVIMITIVIMIVMMITGIVTKNVRIVMKFNNQDTERRSSINAQNTTDHKENYAGKREIPNAKLAVVVNLQRGFFHKNPINIS